MKSKKGVALGILAAFVVIVTGCGDNNVKNDHIDNQAYIKEGNGEENAVNTLQVGTKYKIVGPMDELRDAVIVMMGENYWPDTLLNDEELAERTGISDSMYNDFLAEYQHTEAGIDMMILIEAKEDEIPVIENYLTEYRELLLRIYEQQPQNRAKVAASRIEVIDNTICYVQLGADISGLEAEGEEVMISYCQQENEKALDLMEKKILSD
ncbi:MAG: DUF4358 domain-containing protein [Lachnospiraceae bacterium]|nr:DUF4358 domain-containing protein [Lachnospiraceae bacterium]